MKKEKGFTLIELLAVIVILAIIALIATPLAINVIDNARKNAFKNTAYGLIDAVKLQYAENYLNGNTNDLFYTFPEATGLNFSGERPKGGTIRLTGTGKISLAVYNDKWCAVKSLDTSEVTLTDYEEGKCILQEEADVPVITLNGKEIMYMGIGDTYTDPGYSVKTVGGEELSNDLITVKVMGQTTNKTEVDTSIEETYSITYSITYKEKTDIKTRTVHVGNYDPTIIIKPNGTSEYEQELDVTISVSSHENFTINGFTYILIKDNVEISTETVEELTKVITLNEDGTYQIKVTATDSEGNTSEYTSEEYKIDVTIPEPNIVATTSPNANGWYKEDIGFNITTEEDESRIKEIKYCKTNTSTSCTPNQTVTGVSATATIDTESADNYICAISIDNAGNESENKCSGPYALDKTGPTLTIPADATIMADEATNYDLLNGVSATDGLSDIEGDIKISGNLSAIIGEYTITYTATDNAGNTVEETRIINVIKNTFTVEFNANGGTGTMKNQEFEVDVAKALSTNEFKRSKHVFTGWATSADGSVVYTDDQSVTNIGRAGSNVILYAVWKEITGPMLASGTSWYQGENDWAITHIYFVNEGAPTDYDEVWNADVDGTGSIKGYLKYNKSADTVVVTIVGDGSGYILANPDSSNMFNDFIYTNNYVKTIDMTDLYTGYVENASYMFASLKNISTIVGFTDLDTSSITDMSYMFSNGGMSNIDLRKWDVSNVITMNSMFDMHQGDVTVYLNGWETNSLQDMSGMFYYVDDGGITIYGLEDLDTQNVTDMSSMFGLGTQINNSINLNNWDTSNVKDMTSMFYNTSLYDDQLDLTGFTVTENTDISEMFKKCSASSYVLGPKWTGIKYTDNSPFDDHTSSTTVYVLGKTSNSDFTFYSTNNSRYWYSGTTVTYLPNQTTFP